MEYYINRDGAKLGPYTEDQLRVFVKSGAISRTQHAWHEGLSEWRPLSKLVSLGPDDPAVPSKPKKEVQSAPPLNILVVDDEKSTGKAVCYFLEHAGHKVDVIHDGQEALHVLKTSPGKYQLLITDHSMPSMSGLELVEELQQAKFPGKIIVFTGYLTADLESAYRMLGVKYFFNKPLDLKRLPHLVARLA